MNNKQAISTSSSTSSQPETRSSSQPDGARPMKYVIALGSNIGGHDRFTWIEKACREMEEAGIKIHTTSGLFQTSAMYVEDQDDFLNGVCMVETPLQPVALMKTLQGIEQKLGRVKIVDKGPRNIDLDIVVWEGGEFVSEEPELRIPHRLMGEREFVLAPLCQILPSRAGDKNGEVTSTHLDYPKALLESPSQVPYQELLDRLQSKADAKSSISTRTPMHPSLPLLNPSDPKKKTHIMSILNLTPDSFSDGGAHAPTNREYLRTTILAHLHGGATILDLGGQSSRPGAPDISPEEEFNRLLPALEICKSLREDPNTPPFAISIDTYRAAVAAAAVHQGADIINDISAGLLDRDMLRTVAQLGCTYILMHMRGTPATMTSSENCTYEGDLVHVIKTELSARVVEAEDAGIRRWRMVLDPGIGFAKTGSQNLEILRRLREFTSPTSNADGHPGNLEGIPWLVGASRKGFVGKATGVKEPSQRGWGTAATVTAAVVGGADVVRVHDVAEMVQVARMSEAIYRP